MSTLEAAPQSQETGQPINREVQMPLEPISQEITPVHEQVSTTLELAEGIFETDVPNGINPFSPDASPGYSLLNPSVLDQLEPGNYKVSGKDKNIRIIPGGGDSNKVDVPINIMETRAGKAIEVESHSGLSHIKFTENAVHLMEAMGFVFIKIKVGDTEANRLHAVPTPETLKAQCAALGVDVELLPNTGQALPRDYLKVFSAGKYPVATKDGSYYEHDIQDDHLLGVVLGGEELKDALAIAATKALESDNDLVIGSVTEAVDRFTQTLRAIVATAPTTGEAYGEKMGRDTLHRHGKAAGMSASEIDNILKAAQERAPAYGFSVKQLTKEQ